MLALALVVLAAIALLLFVLRVNRRDRQEIEGLVQENGRQENDLVARLDQARVDYEQALRGGDRDQAQTLGTVYYQRKTDYEYWAAPPLPLPDDRHLTSEERQRQEQEIERDNAALRSDLQARNEQLLEQDLRTMTP